MIPRRPHVRFILSAALVIGVAAGAFVGTIVRESGDASSSRATDAAQQAHRISLASPDAAAYTTDPILTLGTAHRRMIESGGTLVSGVLESGSESASSLMIVNAEVLWSTGDAQPTNREGGVELVLGERVTLASEILPDGWTLGDSVIAIVLSDGELIGVARRNSAGVLVDEGSGGVLYLGAAGVTMAAIGYDPMPDQGCNSSEISASRSPTQALVDYFEILDGASRQSRMTATADIAVRADQIVDSHSELSDPVTGDRVSYGLNHIRSQLESGVAEDDLVLIQEVPALLTVPVGAAGEEVVEFFDSSTGTLLSWFLLSVVSEESADGDILNEWLTRTVYIEPPLGPSDVHVVRRSLDTPGWSCRGVTEGEVLMTIPFDTLAGTERVWIDLNTQSFSEAEVGDFRMVAQGRGT